MRQKSFPSTNNSYHNGKNKYNHPNRHLNNFRDQNVTYNHSRTFTPSEQNFNNIRYNKQNSSRNNRYAKNNQSKFCNSLEYFL